ncbi:MAG: chromosomal replication initiator DnaA [Acetobacter sp.]|jgi:chromosomal replication initiation ATPase DnaA
MSLSLDARIETGLRGFIPSPANAEVREWLFSSSSDEWPDRRLLLWGDAATGKTYLLHLWAQSVQALLVNGSSLTAERLEDIARDLPARIVVDDADDIPDRRVLLHLMNLARETGIVLLLSSRLPPSAWSDILPDLGSRLRATLSVQLRQPDDLSLRRLLLSLFADHQMTVPPAVTEWLLLHLPREGVAIRDAVARLGEWIQRSGMPLNCENVADLLEIQVDTEMSNDSREDEP